ncbi:velvet factor [Polychytrium aggregatum]|uniref:velvet factor n=1 Tax=Polychytrium aggregatum TaxID=110093 RepID=UPI0022FDF284|nr:velvet factor [Polychytrium aggregatum]KAI9208408.1 velvet factor [Polychytrium aggregatum]
MTEASLFVIHVQLYAADGMEDRSLVVNPARLKEAVPRPSTSLALHHRVAHTPPPDTDSLQTENVIGSPSMAPVAAANGCQSCSPDAGSPDWLQDLSDSDQVARMLFPAAQPSLFGNLVSSAVFSKSAQNSMTGVFFVFSKLFIRVEGTYRLKFTLADLGDPCCPALVTIQSEGFVSYGWKNFPAMSEPTSTFKALAQQGVHAVRRSRGRK